MMKIMDSAWHPDRKMIVTQISGDVDVEDVDRWKQSLENALERIGDNGIFKIFVNLHGFKAADIEAHKKFREIIPLTLADYGFRVGYVDLFEDVELPLRNKRGIRCLGAAHVHQDETKIAEYDRRFGRDNEHFFTDPAKAEDWISGLRIAD